MEGSTLGKLKNGKVTVSQNPIFLMGEEDSFTKFLSASSDGTIENPIFIHLDKIWITDTFVNIGDAILEAKEDQNGEYIDVTIPAIKKNGLCEKEIAYNSFRNSVSSMITYLKNEKIPFNMIFIQQPEDVSLHEYVDIYAIVSDVLEKNKLCDKVHVVQEIKPEVPNYELISYIDNDDKKDKKKDKKKKKNKKK